MPSFEGLGAFIAFLPELAAKIEAAQQQGRAAAAERVRQEVVATFGETGSGETGPFPERPALKDATQRARQLHGFAADEPELATGALRDSISATVAADGRTVVGVADATVGSGQPSDAHRDIGEVAVAQEEGTGRLPQRSFLGVGAFRAAKGAAAAFVTPVIAAMAGTPLEETTDGDD